MASKLTRGDQKRVLEVDVEIGDLFGVSAQREEEHAVARAPDLEQLVVGSLVRVGQAI